jgi:hypothetical protein
MKHTLKLCNSLLLLSVTIAVQRAKASESEYGRLINLSPNAATPCTSNPTLHKPQNFPIMFLSAFSSYSTKSHPSIPNPSPTLLPSTPSPFSCSPISTSPLSEEQEVIEQYLVVAIAEKYLLATVDRTKTTASIKGNLNLGDPKLSKELDTTQEQQRNLLDLQRRTNRELQVLKYFIPTTEKDQIYIEVKQTTLSNKLQQAEKDLKKLKTRLEELEQELEPKTKFIKHITNSIAYRAKQGKLQHKYFSISPPTAKLGDYELSVDNAVVKVSCKLGDIKLGELIRDSASSGQIATIDP